MSLTHDQKKYIKKHIQHKPAAEIAAVLGVSQSEILDHLRGNWRQDKFQKYLNRQQAHAEEKHHSAHSLRNLVSGNYINIIFLLLLVGGVFSFSLGGQFVSDDIAVIRDNPNISDGTYPIRENPWGFVRGVIYFLIYSLFGTNPFFYHLLNVLVHMGNVLLLYLLLGLSINPAVAFLAACLFGVHPIISEPVNWISGGAYSQYTFFILSSLLLLRLYMIQGKTWYYAASLAMGAVALLSAGIAMVLPFILTLYTFVFATLKKYWVRLVPYYVLTGVFAAHFLSRVPGRIQSVQHEQFRENIGFNPLMQIPVAITSYFELMVWPDKLSIYHSDFIMGKFVFVLRILIFIAFAVTLAVMFFKNRIVFYGLALFIISLLPTLTPLGISSLMTERYVYFGSTGIFLAVAYLVWRISQNKRYETIVYIIFMVVIGLFSIRTIIRAADWRSEDTLWVATGRTARYDPVAHMNLGDMHRRHKNYAEAEREFQTALTLSPNNAYAYYNLGLTYTEAGEFEKALSSYERAVTIDPTLWQGYQNIGVVYFSLGNVQLAITSMQKAIEIAPQEAQLYANLGMIYLNSNDKPEAEEAFRKALQLDPANEKARQGLMGVGL